MVNNTEGNGPALFDFYSGKTIKSFIQIIVKEIKNKVILFESIRIKSINTTLNSIRFPRTSDLSGTWTQNNE